MTSFVGRRRQLADAKRLLSGTRVLTFTGAGGVGKTRLAVHLAGTVRHMFRDGVRFIGLEELQDPSLLAYTAASSLGLSDQPSRKAIDTLVEYLGPREVLLAVDNCEHLIDDSAKFVTVLAKECPGVRILATSRQSLNVSGETIMHVPPLAAPDKNWKPSPATLAAYDSVQLFVDRANAVVPGFRIDERNCRPLANLCHGLEGIPLAIELAAAWLRVLSLEQIEERLSERFKLLTGGPRGAPSRQRTLRAMMDWSYDLCSEADRKAWARASVFSGSFDLEAIDYVGGGETLLPSLEAVRSLIDKSLLIREEHEGDIRYRMLETVRAYGRERLVEAGDESAVLRRHRDWFMGVAERFEQGMMGPGQVEWFHKLRREHANVRTALTYSLTRPGEAIHGLRIANHLDDYWDLAFQTEARHWLDQALAAASEATPERVTGLRLNAWYALLQGDFEAAFGQTAEATELADRLGCTVESSYLTLTRGIVTMMCGDLETATLLFGGALTGFRDGHHLRGEIFALYLLGLAIGSSGDSERGMALVDESIALSTACGEVRWRAYALWGASVLHTLDDQLESAEDAAREALRLFQRMDLKLGMAFVVETTAWLSERKGDHLRAATLFGAAASIWEDIGSSLDFQVPSANLHRWYADLARAALGKDAFDAAFRRGYELPLLQAIEYVLSPGTKPSTSPRPSDNASTPLTPREREIAGLVAEGLSNKEIAERLVISPRTAETHVQNSLIKLGFVSRSQLAAWFVTQRLAP
ncbi:LuxR C-terminal-related transcriptional regulator [Streptomyces sp. M41]|uniref:LuxR C-terminal-related transcriptional regulator n=1 Tax=Streptomyces sp. M41 TaxID=3059412 RepID=UPI00374D1F60